MAYFDTTWYVNFGDGSTTGHFAVAKRPQNTAVVAGQLVRQFTAPTVGNERVFVCIVAGTTANVADATWVLTRGAKTTDGTATWQEVTGISAVNGDLTNTTSWTAMKAVGTPSLGVIIKRNNGASYQICTTAGTLGTAEPAFSDTAGVTTTETAGTNVWTSLGPVGNFTGGQAPHARMANALTTNWFAAGHTLFVGGNHAETSTAAITISPLGSTTTVNKIICHDQAGSYPPSSSNLATTATISTTAAQSITFSPAAGSVTYFYGLTFRAGVGQASVVFISFSGSNGAWMYFDACSLRLATTSASSYLELCNISYNTLVFNNTTVSFASVSQYIQLKTVNFIWQNTGAVLVAGSAAPTSLLGQAGTSGNRSSCLLEALDLSQMTGSLYSHSGTSVSDFLIKDCKLNAAATVTTPINPGVTVQLVRSSA